MGRKENNKFPHKYTQNRLCKKAAKNQQKAQASQERVCGCSASAAAMMRREARKQNSPPLIPSHPQVVTVEK
jgi:hypothetical protein